MGEAADDAFDSAFNIMMERGDSWSFGRGSYRYPTYSTPPRRTNQQIFRNFTGVGEQKFKAGDRVVHEPSGVAGTVTEILAGPAYVSWRPDTRVLPGSVPVEVSKLRKIDKPVDPSQF